jgi:hypothetical protein
VAAVQLTPRSPALVHCCRESKPRRYQGLLIWIKYEAWVRVNYVPPGLELNLKTGARAWFMGSRPSQTPAHLIEMAQMFTAWFSDRHIVLVTSIASRCALLPENGSEILAAPLGLEDGRYKDQQRRREDDATRKSGSTSC